MSAAPWNQRTVRLHARLALARTQSAYALSLFWLTRAYGGEAESVSRRIRRALPEKYAPLILELESNLREGPKPELPTRYPIETTLRLLSEAQAVFQSAVLDAILEKESGLDSLLQWTAEAAQATAQELLNEGRWKEDEDNATGQTARWLSTVFLPDSPVSEPHGAESFLIERAAERDGALRDRAFASERDRLWRRRWIVAFLESLRPGWKECLPSHLPSRIQFRPSVQVHESSP